MDVNFNGEVVKVAGLELACPLAPYGFLRAHEQLKLLVHDDLARVAEACQVLLHPLMATEDLLLTVSHVLQRAWYEKMGEVPKGVVANHERRLREHARLVDSLNRGETTMATKSKKSKKAPAAAKKPLEYKLYTSKVEADKDLKRWLDPKAETKRHDIIIIQVMADGERRDLAAVVAAVKATGRYTTGDPLDKSVRWHLAKLEKAGWVQATEVAS